MRHFITQLPDELEDVDFRVLAPDGGYSGVFDHIIHERIPHLDILAVHVGRTETYYVLLRVYVDFRELAITGPEVRFEQCSAQILDEDGQETGNFVSPELNIHLDIVRDGVTAGLLKMSGPVTASSLLQEG